MAFSEQQLRAEIDRVNKIPINGHTKRERMAQIAEKNRIISGLQWKIAMLENKPSE